MDKFLCIYQLATLIKISTLKDGKLAPITFSMALVNVNASNYKSLLHLTNNFFLYIMKTCEIIWIGFNKYIVI